MKTFTVKQLAKQCKVDQKVARRRLRDAIGDLDALLVGSGTRWVFPMRAKAKILAVIKA
jgi:phage gp36-like protein